METNKITTRNCNTTDELFRTVEREFKNIKLNYKEAYYLDNAVDEDTGMVLQESNVVYYTKTQVNSNLRALKSAYLIAKGAASPKEIIDFREKYKIAASTLSIILGFSKNTISNIENEGVSSLTSGRLIKMCITNMEQLSNYISLCDSLDNDKKEALTERILGIGM